MKKHKATPRPSIPNIRKVLRKQKRQAKKQHRQEHYLKKKTDKDKHQHIPGRFVKRPADDLDPSTEVKVGNFNQERHQQTICILIQTLI